MIDLHTHTTASDGTLTPSELVVLAKELNLHALGITDHDTVDGLPEAITEGTKHNVNIVCGIELSVDYDKCKETHILGYFSKDSYEDIKPYLVWILKKRDERDVSLINNLEAAGYDISISDVHMKAGGGTPGRPHIASCLIEKGYAKSTNEAFEKILKRKDIFVKREKTSPESAITTILEKGGVPVWAHPVYIDQKGVFNETLEEFLSYGLMGLEVFHSDHTREDTIKYLEAAKRYNLLMTGGSDFHGDNKKEIKLGIPNVSDDIYRKLKKYL